MNLSCKTGSDVTIITPEMYRESMGKVVAARSYLRTRGSTEYLDTKGMFRTTLTTASGATKRAWVYVVEGARQEPHLGDHDAEDLGIVSTDLEGHAPKEEKEGENCKEGNNLNKLDMHRQTDREVITKKLLWHKDETKGKEEASWIVSGYKGPVFTDREGRTEVEQDGLRYEEGHKPEQPARYPELDHYQERHEGHLKKREKEGVREKGKPEEAVDSILNIGISEKRTQGNNSKDSDTRPDNKGAKCTRLGETH